MQSLSGLVAVTRTLKRCKANRSLLELVKNEKKINANQADLEVGGGAAPMSQVMISYKPLIYVMLEFLNILDLIAFAQTNESNKKEVMLFFSKNSVDCSCLSEDQKLAITDDTLILFQSAERVYINGCQNITDDGLKHLLKVKYVNLSGTDCTEAGVESLKKAGVEVDTLEIFWV